MPETISARDKARLLLNTSELANRYIVVADKKYPVLHLGIGDMIKFQAFTADLESLYKRFCETEVSLTDFVEIHSDDVIEYLKTEIPHAAAIVLQIKPEEVRKIGRPLDLLAAVFSQWMHNLEIGKLREQFPYPESDDDKEDLTNPDNPLVIIERLMSGLHFSKEEALKTTYPQVYLMGLSSAESYESIKSDSDEGSKSKGQTVYFRGKRYETIRDMIKECGPEAYEEYYAEQLGRTK